MKETKKLKCFSKMKRIVLTLFAALCVGSVWAAETSMTITNFAVSDSGVVSFDYALSYTGSSTKRMARIVMTYGRRCGEIRSINIRKETSTNNDGFLNPKTTASDSYTSASLDISPNDYWVKIAFYMERTSGAGDYTKTEVFIPQNDNVIIPNEVETYLTHNSETPVKFVVSGAVSSAASEVTGVVIKYGFGTLSEENPLSATASYNPTTKLYTCDIYSSSKTDVLHYNIYSVSAAGEKIYYDVENNVTLLKEQHYEQPYMTYTWTGLGSDNSWDNDNNWDSGTIQCWGYPGHYAGYPKVTSGYYTNRARFTNSTVRVNLNNKTFMPYEQDDNGGGINQQFRGLVFEKPANCQKMNVIFENGAINIKIPTSCGPGLLGQSDVNLEFNNATFGVTTSPNLLVPNASSTIIFSGERDHAWNFAPRGNYSKNFKLIFKNFYGSTYYDSGLTVASGSVIEITNAVWRVRTGKNDTSTASKGFATKVILRDGDTYPAQLKCFAYYSGDDRWADINLNNTYDIKIPAAGHEDASIFAKNLTEAPTATFEIDVSDYDKGAKVPIVELLGGEPAFTTLPTLVAKANGQDVTTARNARLFWDGNFMYFQQDSQNAAEVGGVEYATFADAFAAAEAGATVKLLNDVTLVEKITVKKAVTLDLNGCTLSETVTDSYGAIYIGTAGNLTITDSATGGKIATDGGIVIGNYGTVTVAGGTIEAGAVAEEDTSVYNFYYNGSTYGKLTVNGGKVVRIWNCGNANITAGEVVDIDNSGAMTIAEAATVSGTVIIKNGSDAAEVPGAGTLTAPETLTVQVGNEGYFASYADGKWVLEEAIDDPFVVNGEHYATFAAAYAAVEDGGEITIDERAEGTAFETPGFVLNKSVTIDLKGRTLTLTPPAVGSTGTETLGIQILPAAGRAEAMNVIIKNGTINVAESNLTAEKPIKMMINNYVTGALTLENVTLDGTNLVKPSNMPIYVLSNNRGNVALTGETSIVAPEGAVAFDVCKYATYAVPTVTLNTTGTIAGKVEVSGGDFVIGDENTAEISAIDFTAGSVKGNVEEVLAIPEDKKLVETDGVYTLADKDVLAKVGDELFETIAEAFDVAQAGDTVILEKNLTVESALIIPEGVTLDLNGKTFTGDALGVVAVNKGTYVTPQNYKMVGPDADYYKSENAVLTIGATSITLNSGSLEVVPTEWWTLPGQTLTIDAGAEFIIPAGKKMNNNGSTVVIKGTLSGDGAINLYSLDATVQGAEGLNITTTVEGYCVAFANGVYKLEEIPAEFAAQVGAEKYPTLQAALDVEANLAVTITLIANTKENITIPAGFTGTIDLNGFTLTGRIDSYATGVVLKNGSVIHTAGSKAAIQIEAGSLELTDINMESNYHGVRLNGAGTTATINSGTYRITSSSGTYNLIYASGANAKFYVYGGEFYNNGDTGSTWVLKAYASGAEINVYGGTFSAYSANTFEVAKGGVIKVFGGTFTGCNPSATTHATVQPGYAVEGTGPWTVVASWTAPMPEKDGGADITEEYTSDVLSALEAAVATSVDVKVNGTELKGNEAVKALNTAVKCFDGALTFDGTAASVDIVIEVTEVNTEDPAASTVVVKRGETVLSVKTGITPTVKYIDLGSDAVVFKLVFE